MARILICGFEADTGTYTASTNAIDGYGGTRDTTVYRSGGSSQRLDAGGSLLAIGPNADPYAPDVYVSYWFYKNSNPSATQTHSQCGISKTGGSIGTVLFVRLDSSGRLGLYNSASSLVGSLSAALANDTWHLVEFRLQVTSSTTVTGWLRVNGTELATSQTLYTSTNLTGYGFGSVVFIPPTTSQPSYWVDDLVVDDADWVGGSRVALLLPTSDVQRGSWTGGAGGTTNLYDAIDNRPPIGTASETNLTQIESADSSGNNSTDEYVAGLTTYAAAGITGTVKAAQAWIAHGEDVATGTKRGSIELRDTSGGVLASAVSFTAGGDIGALGTFPTNWRYSSAIVSNPATEAGRIALRKTDTTTRVLSICFAGVYVEYVPPSIPTLSSPGVINITSSAATPQVTLTF